MLRRLNRGLSWVELVGFHVPLDTTHVILESFQDVDSEKQRTRITDASETPNKQINITTVL